jgi:hypothetical protein
VRLFVESLDATPIDFLSRTGGTITNEEIDRLAEEGAKVLSRYLPMALDR